MLREFRNPSTVKIKNMKFLYKLIRETGPITKSSIIERTGLKQTTCTRIIDDLLIEGLIRESGVAESSGGRKPVMYDLQMNRFYSIGIDISRTFIKVLLLDVHLNVIDSDRLPIHKNSTPELTILFIHETIEKMLMDHQFEKGQLVGIGIGSVEPIDRKNGVILNPLDFPNDEWVDVKIVDALKEQWDTTILLDSGINSAVLAEHQKGLDGSIGNISYIIAGMGLRIGTMIDHQLVKSESARFSKFGGGHMVINTSGRKCICGKYGCLHTYSTIPALKEEIAHQMKLGKNSILQSIVPDPDELDFEDICKAIDMKDSLCTDVIKEFGFFTGIGIANMITLIHSDYVMLGGPMFNRMELYYGTAVETATDRLHELYPGYNVNFRKGILGENAAAIGAGGMIFDYYLD